MSDFIEICGIRLPADFSVESKWITDRLAIGGMIGTSANIQGLKRLGITHVIDLQAEFDDTPLAAEAAVGVLWLPVPNSPGPVSPEAVRHAAEFAGAVLAEDGSRLFVHCMAGRNRAPTFAYAILRAQGWNREDALSRILQAEPRALLEDRILDTVDMALAVS
jgi:predicted protein tyrosine phosphatase